MTTPTTPLDAAAKYKEQYEHELWHDSLTKQRHLLLEGFNRGWEDYAQWQSEQDKDLVEALEEWQKIDMRNPGALIQVATAHLKAKAALLKHSGGTQ